jgi:hypothetical protein
VRRVARSQLRTSLFHVVLVAFALAFVWALVLLVGVSQARLALVIVAIFAGGAVSLAAVMIVVPGVSAGELRDRLLFAARSRRFHGGEPIPGLEPGFFERVVNRLLRAKP